MDGRTHLKAFIGLGLLALCCACAASVSSTGSHKYISVSALPQTANIKYLYVAYLNPAHVVRYPIVNGMLSTTPDNDLNVTIGSGGRIGGIALDAQGELYVALLYGGGTIAVYSEGASGNASPVRTIAIPNSYVSSSISDGVRNVAVDPSGTAYVGILRQEGYFEEGLVQIFAPNANGSPAPLQTLQESYATTALALDAAGHLYVGSYGGLSKPPTRAISVFPNPLASPAPSYPICDENTITGMTVGAMRGWEWLIASEHVLPRRPSGRLTVWKGVRSRACPRVSPQTLTISGLNNPAPPHNNTGFSAVALDSGDERLFVAARGAVNHAVYEINPLVFTPQKPIVTITSSNIPIALAVSQ